MRYLLFLFSFPVLAAHMDCELSRWSESEGSSSLQKWRSPVINHSVYYYSDLTESFEEAGHSLRIAARYSLANGFFYAEIFDRDDDVGSYSDSYQLVDSPNILTRFKSLQLRCYFIKSQAR